MKFEFDSISLIQLAKRSNPPAIVEQGRVLTSYIKAGRTDALQKIMTSATKQFIRTHINKEATFVPVPRSSPLLANAVWPGRLICLKLLSMGFGKDMYDVLERKRAVQTGHFNRSAENRATIDQHYNTIEVTNTPLIVPEQIVLVDDVITQGRTAVACYIRLREIFPHTAISIFTPVITKAFDEVNLLIDPKVCKVQYFDSGKSIVACRDKSALH
jgi:predicted amidophosphoribosyltransferase